MMTANRLLIISNYTDKVRLTFYQPTSWIKIQGSTHNKKEEIPVIAIGFCSGRQNSIS